MYVTLGGHRKCYYLGTDKNDAETRYHTLMLEYQKIKKRPQEKQTGGEMLFRRLVERYLEDAKHSISPSTYRGYKTSLAVVCRLFPNIAVKEIDANTIRRLKQYLLRERKPSLRKQTGVSNNTCNKYLTYIGIVLNWGINNEYLHLTDITLSKIKREPDKRKPPRFFTPEELQKIFACEKAYASTCCRKDLLRETIPMTFAMIYFMIASGRRIQEVVHLKKKDIYFDEGYYEVTKDKTARSNPRPKIFHLNEAAAGVIKPLYDTRKDDEYIIQGRGGSFLTPTAAGQRFKRILKMAGIEGAASKELRHTFASHMLMSGESLESLREHLGHTDIKTTQIYSHLSSEYLKKSINNPKFAELLKTVRQPETQGPPLQTGV